MPQAPSQNEQPRRPGHRQQELDRDHPQPRNADTARWRPPPASSKEPADEQTEEQREKANDSMREGEHTKEREWLGLVLVHDARFSDG